jgi:uncharacterized protein YndB with AHSA1/START domain
MRIIMFVCGFLMTCSAALAQTVANTSYVTPSGERVLQHQAVVDASLADVWGAFTTSEGLRGFVAPVARIDFRVGGLWEASYNPQARIGDPGNIRNEIITYVPLRLLAIRVVNAPPTFPYPDVIKNVWTVIELEDLGLNRVRVTGSMTGWKTGPSWDAVYKMFEADNAVVLGNLQKRFHDGPRKWEQPAASR